MKERYLLAGATGLVGSHLALHYPNQLIGLARKKPAWPSPIPVIEADILSSPLPMLPWDELTGIIFLAFPTKIVEVQSYSLSKQHSLLKAFRDVVVEAKKHKLPILFFSSDAVFWGTPPKERTSLSKCNPTQVYGVLKETCEKILLNEGEEGSVVVRATPVGFHPFNVKHGFLGGLLTEMLSKHYVFGFKKNLISPISLNTTDKKISEWMKDPKAFAKHWGAVVQLASTKPISKYELLAECARVCGVSNYLGEKVRELDQTLLPSTGMAVSLEETLQDVLQGLDEAFLFSTRKSPMAK